MDFSKEFMEENPNQKQINNKHSTYKKQKKHCFETGKGSNQSQPLF
jgi:hypothetical protein